MGTAPSDPDFLFRAHKHVGTSQPMFVPELNLPFNLEFRRTFSIDDFAVFLAEHLNRTRKEKETGEKIETCFVSMSAILEWTIHTTGQKWKDRDPNEEEVAGLAIFDVKKLRQASESTIIRVSDVLKFLTIQGRGQLIAQDLQQWAQNCDEYVSIGKVHECGLIRWVLWEELLPARILSQCFLRAYTLAKYREWMDEQHIKLETICQRIVKFGKILAGPQDDILLPLIELILRPGIQFWGFKTDSSEDVVEVKTRVLQLLDEAALEKFSGLSI
jgi:hypothetical protein